jgi:hypothetical protein
VGGAMQKHSVKPGVAKNDLDATLGGRVLAKNRIELFPDGGKHRRPGDQAGE